ncbi:MAG: dephospho-CoA kinase [Candidatus Eisenbacteria bacterium]|nr:dephospho-CoA kinase [Candidatus Eisenbacteria bacterium]
MFRIGLAGGMGSGKSEVAARLGELGALVIEADAVARDIVAVGTEVHDAIRDAFGKSVLADDGSLDRGALAAVAFSSEERTGVLNAITHPALIDEIMRRSEGLERRNPQGVLVVDAALLVQWDVLDMFDVVLVVHAPRELRVSRLVEAGFGEEDVRLRMHSQLPDEVMLAAADVVIENGGSIDELRAAVDGFWESLPGTSREDER